MRYLAMRFIGFSLKFSQKIVIAYKFHIENHILKRYFIESLKSLAKGCNKG